MLRLSIDMRCWALLSSSGIYEKNDIARRKEALRRQTSRYAWTKRFHVVLSIRVLDS